MEENWIAPLRDVQCESKSPDPDDEKRTEQLEFLDYLERALLKKIKKENQTSDVKRRFTKSRLLTYRNLKFMEEETTVANLMKYHRQLRKRATHYKKEFNELAEELDKINRVCRKRLGMEEFVSKPVKEFVAWKRTKHVRGPSVGPTPDQPKIQCGRYSKQLIDSIVGPDSLESLIRSRNASFSNIGMRCPVIEALCWFNRNKHMGERTYNVCVNKQIYFLSKG